MTDVLPHDFKNPVVRQIFNSVHTGNRLAVHLNIHAIFRIFFEKSEPERTAHFMDYQQISIAYGATARIRNTINTSLGCPAVYYRIAGGGHQKGVLITPLKRQLPHRNLRSSPAYQIKHIIVPITDTITTAAHRCRDHT